MDLSKPESNMHFKIAKIEDAYTWNMKGGLNGFVLSFILAWEENPISSFRNLYSLYCINKLLTSHNKEIKILHYVNITATSPR